MTTIYDLKGLDIFEGFTDQKLGKILEISSPQTHQNKERLFKKGDDAGQMWIVMDGSVELRFEMPQGPAENTISSHNKGIPLQTDAG